MTEVSNPDEFYSEVKESADSFRTTSDGRKISEYAGEKFNKSKEFNLWYENIIPVEYELLDDYFLLFKSNRMDAGRVTQTLINDGIKFISKMDGNDMNFIIFFDCILNHEDKNKILQLLSKQIMTYLELLDDQVISVDYDPDLISIETGSSLYANDWSEYFYFNNYFETDTYHNEDKYNMTTLPTNHVEIIELDERRKKYNITKSNKRIQVSN